MSADLDLALAAAAAYEPDPPGTIIDHEDLRVVINDGVVAVRGNVQIGVEDWLKDFDGSKDSEFGECHAGFLDGARGLFPMVKDALQYEPQDYVMVGHGLGGGVAIILAALLIRIMMPPIRLVTFGAPQVGGSNLRKTFVGTAVTQYRCGNDPVTEATYEYYEHLRMLTQIGQSAHDPIDCHAIIMVVAALQPMIAKTLAPVIAALFKP